MKIKRRIRRSGSKTRIRDAVDGKAEDGGRVADLNSLTLERLGVFQLVHVDH